MLKKDISISKSIIFLLFSIFFIVGIITFKDYGISVDEEFQRRSGFYWLNYVLSFTFFNELNNAVAIKLTQITGFTLSPIEGNQFYGVIFDLPVALLEVIFKIDEPKNYFYFNLRRANPPILKAGFIALFLIARKLHQQEVVTPLKLGGKEVY